MSNVIPLQKPEEVDFFKLYFDYIGKSEAPKIYHRWAILSAVGALLVRQFYLPFGHSKVYPNMYVFLVGQPGARKGTAMKPVKNLLQCLKYKKVSPQRLSPEMFLAQLQKINKPPPMELLSDIELDSVLIQNPCEMYVMADELGDFIRGNVDFVNMLTNLWDNLPEYDNPKLTSKDVYVFEPTINIIGGITPEGITLSVPPATMGQGFFSRLVLVFAEPTGIKITIPPAPDTEIMNALVDRLQRIQNEVRGEAYINPEAYTTLETIYKRFVGIEAGSFSHYNSRRFDHLLKLTLVMAALDVSTEIKKEHVLKANTILYVTEHRMPKALGEFGRGRNAAVNHKVMELLKHATIPMDIKAIWRHVANDLNKKEELIQIIMNLEYAEKLQRMQHQGKTCFLPLHKDTSAWQKGLLWEEKGFLFAEEMI